VCGTVVVGLLSVHKGDSVNYKPTRERERERERESRFLTTHQHIIGYTESFTLYDLHKMDSRQIKKMTGYRN